MSGEWVHVPSDRARCGDCGTLAESTWRFFPRPATWTLALCQLCVTERLIEAAEAKAAR
jgi:hypothetical protein